MKPSMKNIVIPAVSALAGGAAVVAALKMSPTLRLKLESQSTNRTNESLDQVFDDILKQQNGIRHQFDSLFDDDFFGHNDPFTEMKKMREQMRKRMDHFDGGLQSMSNPFDSWFSGKFGGGSINDISKREDQDFVYYDIKVDDVNSTSVNTKIENGYITITGTQEKKSSTDEKNDSGGKNESYFKSTFNRTFPLPDHVDSNKMEMVPEQDKIVLKFPKVKT